MESVLYFILTLLPLPVWMLMRRRGIRFQLLLSFSGAFLLGMMFTHVLPEVFRGNIRIVGPVILGGFFIQLMLEHLTRGIEHGHVHTHNHPPKGFPWLFLGALYFHAFTEALPLANFAVHEHAHFNPRYYAMGLLIHKWPVVLALLTFLDRLHIPLRNMYGFTLLFATAMPLGSILAPYIPLGADAGNTIRIFLAFSVGILLHVSTTILFEAEEGHRWQWRKIGVVILGFALSLALI